MQPQEGVVLELLVVDRGSTDGSREFLATQPDVQLLHEPASTGLVSGYATGAEVARHSLLFFCNEDMWFASLVMAVCLGNRNSPICYQ